MISEDFGIPNAKGISVEKLVDADNITLALAYGNANAIRHELNDLYAKNEKPSVNTIISRVSDLEEDFENRKAKFEKILDQQIKEGVYVPPTHNQDVSSSSKERYDQLSSNIRSTGYERTKQITETALSSGDSPENVKQMLTLHDKSYQSVEEKSPNVNKQMISFSSARASQPITSEEKQVITVGRSNEADISL
jgi:hypothetical protein